MTGTWRAATATHVGHVRARNEDALAADPARGVFLLADGMGGHAGGDVASTLALEAARAALAGPWPQTAGLNAAVGDAIARADQAVRARGAAEAALSGMGTTLTVVLAPPGHGVAAYGHVGDSRLYHWRSGLLRQISQDQTVAMRLVRDGLMGRAEAPASPYWHLLEQPIGTAAAVAPEVGTLDLAAGDVLLLCSDGLSDMVPDAMVGDLIASHADAPAAAAAALVEAALAAGGHDNVSVVVALLVG